MTKRGAPRRADTLPEGMGMQSKVERAIGVLEEYSHDDSTLFLWSGGKEANVIADLLLYAIGDENEVSPCPFGFIDTGYQFEQMIEFRDNYVSDGGVGPVSGISEENMLGRWHEELLDILDDKSDPRFFHGEWENPKCKDCDTDMITMHEDLDDGEDAICINCNRKYTWKDVEGVPKSEEDYSVETSCDLVKSVPYRGFIEEGGYDIVITGLRDSGRVVDRDYPAEHTQVNPLSGWTEQHVWAYVKAQSVPLSSLYTSGQYTHTDSICCSEEKSRVISNQSGVDMQNLEDLGYI